MRYLLRPVVVCLRYWPQLAACYLLGLLGRRAAIELAAWAGHDNDLWVSLIMPFAGLARLGSYVAMFLVLRRAFPVLAARPTRSPRRIDVFSTVIVPFFAIYLAWQMFREDWLAFEARAIVYRAGAAMTTPGPTELHPDVLPVGTTTWVLIVAALVTRYVLSWLKDRMPGWMISVRVYVDALWTFLAASFAVNQGLTILTNPSGWVAERRIVVWFNTTREELFSHFQPLESVWDTAMWAVRTVFGGAAVPLMWLAVAGIVYGVSATAGWRATARRVAGERAALIIDRKPPARLTAGWTRMPGQLREKVREHMVSQLGKFKPIAASARIILQAGLLVLSLYVLAYLGLAWLDMAGSFYRAQLGSGYLLRGMAWLLGPHPWSFWFGGGVLDTLALISHLIVEPLRICLIAATLAYCLEHPPEEEPATATAAAESESIRPAS